MKLNEIIPTFNNRLINIVSENIEHSLLYEGLIYSYPIEKLESALKRKFKCQVIKNKHEMQFDTYNTITLKSEKNDFNELEKILKTYGWFISIIYAINGGKSIFIQDYEKLQDIDYTTLQIEIEANYDLEVSKQNLPKYLYHLTNSKNIEKIKAKGLIPKSNSKASKHLERIYLTANKQNTDFLAKQLHHSGKYESNVWYLLQIDIGLQSDKLKYFLDPNFTYGVYLLNSINPMTIKIIDKFEV